MTEVIITGAVGMATTIVSGIVSWLSAKKKYNAEVDSTLIQNIQNSLEFYKNLVDDNTRRLEDVLERNKELEKRNQALEDKVSNLNNQMFTLMTEICLDFSCQRRVRKTNLFGNNKQPNGPINNQKLQEK